MDEEDDDLTATDLLLCLLGIAGMVFLAIAFFGGP